MLEQRSGEEIPPRIRSVPALFGSEPLFRRLMERLPAGAYTCDADGLITWFNPHAARLWGREPKLNDPVDRFCGSFRLYSEDGAPIAHDRCWMALALRTEREYNGREIVVERPDGSRVTAQAYANPVHDDAGRLIGAVNVLVDVSHRRAAEDALREADRAKNEFLATMSHEIRTPINAITGYVDLLEMEVAGPLTEGQRIQLARVQAASRHLLSLVTDVLDLAKIEAGRMVVRRAPHRTSDAAAAAVAVVQPLAAAKGIALRDGCAADPCPAYLGDEDRVRQMLINLLSNAIKFSEPGGRVEVDCDVAGRSSVPPPAAPGSEGWVRVRVRDSGIGIAPDQLERIFEPFVQVEAARTRTHGGTGLGLAISRRLARLMGGDLTVESAAGAGSTFTLWLPAASAEPAPVGDGRVAATTGAPGSGPHLAAAGHALLADLDEILRAYVGRLREEEVGPGARTLPDARLAGHAATLLADIAVALLALEDGDRAPATFATGSEVQRACAVEHGRQRGHLGWSEEDLARDYAALAEEVARHVRRRASGRKTELEGVLAVLRGRLEQAREHSERGLRSARSDG